MKHVAKKITFTDHLGNTQHGVIYRGNTFLRRHRGWNDYGTHLGCSWDRLQPCESDSPVRRIDVDGVPHSYCLEYSGLGKARQAVDRRLDK